MNPLLFVFLSFAFHLHRFPGSVSQQVPEYLSAEERQSIIRTAEEFYLRIPSQIGTPGMAEDSPEEFAAFSALLLVEKDLLKSLSRQIHRSPQEWDYLLRRLADTTDEIRLLLIRFSPQTTYCRQSVDTRPANTCESIWSALDCILGYCLTD
ncbi:MAG: hypothetical protein R3C61_18670 [Bacteroidia bacterium]